MDEHAEDLTPAMPPADAPFADVVKFADAHGISLDTLARQMAAAKDVGHPASGKPSSPSSSSNSQADDSAANRPPVTTEVSAQVSADDSAQRSETQSPESAQAAAPTKATTENPKQQQPSDGPLIGDNSTAKPTAAQNSNAATSAPKDSAPSGNQNVDGKSLQEIQARLGRIEETIGSDKANHFGDPSAHTKAQSFRDLPVRDALELIFQRVGPEFMQTLLPP